MACAVPSHALGAKAAFFLAPQQDPCISTLLLLELLLACCPAQWTWSWCWSGRISDRLACTWTQWLASCGGCSGHEVTGLKAVLNDRIYACAAYLEIVVAS